MIQIQNYSKFPDKLTDGKDPNDKYLEWLYDTAKLYGATYVKVGQEEIRFDWPSFHTFMLHIQTLLDKPTVKEALRIDFESQKKYEDAKKD